MGGGKGIKSKDLEMGKNVKGWKRSYKAKKANDASSLNECFS